MTGSFRLAYVPGVTPGKWVRTWAERMPDLPLTLVRVEAADAAALVRDREVDAVLLRLPTDRTGLHAIPLYTETTVIVSRKDHPFTEVSEGSTPDVTDLVLLHPLDDVLDWAGPPGRSAVERPATTADAIELVAAGVGLVVVPQSLARLHHRRDLTYHPFPAAPESRVALAWREDETTDHVEQFIGIVRGRTVNSTRGHQEQGRQPPATPRSATADHHGATRPGGGGRAGAQRRGGQGGGKRGKPRRRH